MKHHLPNGEHCSHREAHRWRVVWVLCPVGFRRPPCLMPRGFAGGRRSARDASIRLSFDYLSSSHRPKQTDGHRRRPPRAPVLPLPKTLSTSPRPRAPLGIKMGRPLLRNPGRQRLRRDGIFEGCLAPCLVPFLVYFRVLGHLLNGMNSQVCSLVAYIYFASYMLISSSEPS